MNSAEAEEAIGILCEGIRLVRAGKIEEGLDLLDIAEFRFAGAEYPEGIIRKFEVIKGGKE